MSEPKRGLRRIATVLLAAGLIAGCSGEKPAELFAKAQQHYQGGDRKAAIIELKNVLQKEPGHREARLLLGRVYVDEGNGPAAEKELRRALELGASHEQVLPLLGRALLLQGAHAKVLEEIPAAPTGAAAALLYAQRGEAHAALGQSAEARAAFEQARRLAPGLPEANRGLAALALAEHKPDAALALAEEAISRSGDQADPWMLKGDLLRAQGKSREAAAAYQEALRRDPGHVRAHLSLALIHLAEKDYTAAQKAIDQARRLQPKAVPVRLAQAQLWLAQRKFAEARDELQEVLRLAPDNGAAILMMGAAQLGLNNLAQARTYLTTFVEAVPRHAGARRLLAVAYLRDKQPKKTLEILEPVLEEGSADPAVLALAGEASLQLKQYAKATEYLEKATEAHPDASLRTQLGLSRLAGGDPSAALADLEAAARMAGSPVESDLALIAAHLARRDHDAALEAIAQLERKQPGLPLVDNLRGVVRLAKGDVAAARADFEKALGKDPGFYPAAANLARLDLANRNPQAARRRFEGVLAADGKNIGAMMGLAAVERAAGNAQAMVDWLEKAARTDAKAIPPRALLVQHFLEQKQPQRALVVAREAVAANPDSGRALELLGHAQLAAGENDNALATFGKLVELRPDSPSARLRLASAQMAVGHAAEARRTLTRALEIKPDFLDAQLALIALDMRDRRVEDALRRARTIQTQHPKSAAGYLVEGDIQASQNQPLRAAGLYRKAFELDHDPVIARKLHGSLLQAGQSTEAAAVADRWLKDHPVDVGMRIHLAQTHLERGEDKQAIAHYRAVLARQPDHLVALNNLAWLLNKAGDAQALAFAERAHKLRPEEPTLLDTLGWIHVTQGRISQGRELLAKAVAKAPGEPSIRYHYAVALAKGGEGARARQEVQRALDAGVRFPEEKEARALLDQLKSGRS